MYVHKLINSKGEVGYHLRGKGLTQQSIKKNCIDKEGVYDPIKFYTSIYNGATATFDLTEGQPCFKFNKDLTVSTLDTFKRKVKASYEKGDRNKYFDE